MTLAGIAESVSQNRLSQRWHDTYTIRLYSIGKLIKRLGIVFAFHPALDGALDGLAPWFFVSASLWVSRLPFNECHC
jgi:hypothetical protein